MLFADTDSGDHEGGERVREQAKSKQAPVEEPSQAPDKKPKSGWGTEAGTSTPKASDESNIAEYTGDEAAGSAGRRAEEEEDESLVQEVAAPPKQVTKPVVSIRELEKESKFVLPPPPDPGIDLSALSALLRPPILVTESDELWETEGMFVKLTGEILAEQEEEEQDKEAKEIAEAEQKKLMQSPHQLTVTVSLTGVGSVMKV